MLRRTFYTSLGYPLGLLLGDFGVLFGVFLSSGLLHWLVVYISEGDTDVQSLFWYP